MKKIFPILLLTVSSLALAGEAEVSFSGVDKYVDGTLEGRDADAAPKALSAHFEKLAQKYLPAGQRLQVEVTDLDLAGAEEWHPPSTRMIRVLREVTPPAVTLRYRLMAGDKEVASANARVVDLDYLHHINPYGEGTAYRYEKLMLDDWFRKTFSPKKDR